MRKIYELKKGIEKGQKVTEKDKRKEERCVVNKRRRRKQQNENEHRVKWSL